MTYTYGVHGAPAVGGGLPGLPQRGSSDASRGGLVQVSLDAFSGVPYGKQVSRTDYPSLSDALPPTMLCQAFGCQVFSSEVLGGHVQPSWSGDGKYLLGHRSIRTLVDDVLTEVHGAFTMLNNSSTSVDANGETFVYMMTSDTVSILTRNGAVFSSPAPYGGTSATVTDVTMRPDGLSFVMAVASTSMLREYRRANKSSTTWTGPTSIGSTSTGTCRAAQFDRTTGEYLLAVKASQGLELYRLVSGVYTLVHSVPGTYGGGCRIAWSPDGTKVAVVTNSALAIYLVQDNTLQLLRSFTLPSTTGPGVTWHNNTTVLAAGEVFVTGSRYEQRVEAFDVLTGYNLRIGALISRSGNIGLGGIASSGIYIATCRDLTFDLRGSTKQVIASLAQPDIYIG